MVFSAKNLDENHILRLAIREDNEKIRKLVRQVIQEFSFEYNSDGKDSDLKDVTQSYAPPSEYFLVLENLQGEIVGTVSFKKISRDTAELCRLYLLPCTRGLGLGKKMLAEIIVLASKVGYKNLILETHSRLADAAKLYKKFGFEEIAPYSGKELDFCDSAYKKEITCLSGMSI